MNLLKIFKSLPSQLLLALLLGTLSAYTFPTFLLNSFFTASCFLKDLLIFILPFIIFSYTWAAIVSFGHSGLWLIFSVLSFIVLSNFIAVFFSYGASYLFLPYILDQNIAPLTQNASHHVNCLWSISDYLPLKIMQPKFGLLAGLLFAILTLWTKNRIFTIQSHSFQVSDHLLKAAFTIRRQSTQFLRTYFIPLLPFYIFGFVIKLVKDGNLLSLLHGYAHTFMFICLMIGVYLFILYWVGNSFCFSKTWLTLKNMIPAGITGFTTMSSSATMPVTIDACEKNLNNRAFADFFVPATVNAHLTGDNVSIIITSIALIMLSHQPFPSLSTFFFFAVQYCLVKFSAAGVPGGGVIVIVPVVKEYLGLDDSIATLLQTIYILQDPLLTASNVMGNGAFTLIGHKILNPFLKSSDEDREDTSNKQEELLTHQT